MWPATGAPSSAGRKLRGLPVRRMPGEGRATVYALISELDEWLASSKPDETEVENADPARTGSRAIGSGASEDGVVVPGAGAGSAAQAQSFAGNPQQAGTELFAANTEPRGKRRRGSRGRGANCDENQGQKQRSRVARGGPLGTDCKLDASGGVRPLYRAGAAGGAARFAFRARA